MFTSTPIDSLIHIHHWEQSSNTASIRHRSDIYKHGTLRASPTITVNGSLKNQLSMVFWSKVAYCPTHKAQLYFTSLLPTDYWERSNPLNPNPSTKIKGPRSWEGCPSLNNQSPMKIYGIHGTIGWDEHAALAQKTLKANYWENHFIVTIGVAIRIRRFKRDV